MSIQVYSTCRCRQVVVDSGLKIETTAVQTELRFHVLKLVSIIVKSVNLALEIIPSTFTPLRSVILVSIYIDFVTRNTLLYIQLTVELALNMKFGTNYFYIRKVNCKSIYEP